MPEHAEQSWWRSHLTQFKRLMCALDETRVFGVAAETAFWTFLSLIPLAAVTGLIAARFSVANWRDVAPLIQTLPGPARQLLHTEMRELAAWNSGTISLVSGSVFVWLASSGVHAIFDALELQVSETSSWLHKRVRAIAACFALPIAVSLVALVGPGIDGVLHALGFGVVNTPSAVSGLLSFLTSATLLLMYVSGLYVIGIPTRARRRMPLLPGAIVAVALQLLAGFGYGLYVSQMGDGSAYVAGLAVIGITLIGLYLFSVAMLIGVVVNRLLGERARGVLGSPESILHDCGEPPRSQAKPTP